MNDSIIKLRERLVELSTDPIETRNLLDKLAEEEIDQANIESPFHVGKNDIEETKDLGFAQVHETRNHYCLHYHGGYSVLVDKELLSPASALQQIMYGVPEDIDSEDEQEAVELALSAAEMIFRLPMFVFSHPITMFNIATMGTLYIGYMQKKGEVPTEETDNPEYDKFLQQSNELLENLAAGLEKEGKEYEKRMGYATEENKESKEDNDKSEGEGEA